MAHSQDDLSPRKSPVSFEKSERPSRVARWLGKSGSPLPKDWRDMVEPAFVARCEPRRPGAPYTSGGLSVIVSQWIRRGREEELWDSLIVRCDEEDDGTMTVRVVVSNPDWDQRLQIACLQSRPGDQQSMTPLACNLNHEDIG